MLEVKLIAMILIVLVIDYIFSKRELKEEIISNSITQKVVLNTVTLTRFIVSTKLFLLGLMCGAIVYTKDANIIITEMELTAWLAIVTLTAIPLVYQFIGSHMAYTQSMKDAYNNWITSVEYEEQSIYPTIDSFEEKNQVGKVITKAKKEEYAVLKTKAIHLLYRVFICIIISI